MVPNTIGFYEVDILMTSLPVFDNVIFSVIVLFIDKYTFTNLKRIVKAVLGD